jgi:SAM-dependent methyltransferase
MSIHHEFETEQRAFAARAKELGLQADPLFLWYHVIDLGDGLITPGTFDIRPHIDAYGLNQSMAGKRALDIGTANGYFAFEMAKRGAAVTTVELPALTDIDHFPGESKTAILDKVRFMMETQANLSPEDRARLNSSGPEDIYHLLLEGPFRFCEQRLGLKMERHYARIYDLAPAAFGDQLFDVVMLGDLLVHTVNPTTALAAAASVCGDTLILAEAFLDAPDHEPQLRYLGGDGSSQDHVQWWSGNVGFYRQILKRLGFRSVEVVGTYQQTVRPVGYQYRKDVLQARR